MRDGTQLKLVPVIDVLEKGADFQSEFVQLASWLDFNVKFKVLFSLIYHTPSIDVCRIVDCGNALFACKGEEAF